MENYLNNAGAGLLSSKTYEVITNHLLFERKIGAYKAAFESKNKMDEFYTLAARVVNASKPNEIAFVDSASRGLNMAFYGSELKKGDQIITLASEFGTNLLILFDLAKKIGATVNVIPCDIEGNFSISEMEKVLKKGACLIAISHAAAHGSIVNPVVEIGILAKQYRAIYIVDGCQTVGQIPIDVQSLQCDAYITTGRKWLCGPRGTGFMYVRQSSPLRTTQIDLSSADLILSDEFDVLGVKVRSDARQFELWERNIANMLGLSSAIKDYLGNDQSIFSSRIRTISNLLRSAVLQNTNLNLIGKQDSNSGIVGFYLKDFKREKSILDMFEQEGLIISTMSDWDCPLHFPRNGASIIYRLSPHYYTDDSTISKACGFLSTI